MASCNRSSHERREQPSSSAGEEGHHRGGKLLGGPLFGGKVALLFLLVLLGTATTTTTMGGVTTVASADDTVPWFAYRTPFVQRQMRTIVVGTNRTTPGTIDRTSFGQNLFRQMRAYSTNTSNGAKPLDYLTDAAAAAGKLMPTTTCLVKTAALGVVSTYRVCVDETAFVQLMATTFAPTSSPSGGGGQSLVYPRYNDHICNLQGAVLRNLSCTIAPLVIYCLCSTSTAASAMTGGLAVPGSGSTNARPSQPLDVTYSNDLIRVDRNQLPWRKNCVVDGGNGTDVDCYDRTRTITMTKTMSIAVEEDVVPTTVAGGEDGATTPQNGTATAATSDGIGNATTTAIPTIPSLSSSSATSATTEEVVIGPTTVSAADETTTATETPPAAGDEETPTAPTAAEEETALLAPVEEEGGANQRRGLLEAAVGSLSSSSFSSSSSTPPPPDTSAIRRRAFEAAVDLTGLVQLQFTFQLEHANQTLLNARTIEDVTEELTYLNTVANAVLTQTNITDLFGIRTDRVRNVDGYALLAAIPVAPTFAPTTTTIAPIATTSSSDGSSATSSPVVVTTTNIPSTTSSTVLSTTAAPTTTTRVTTTAAAPTTTVVVPPLSTTTSRLTTSSGGAATATATTIIRTTIFAGGTTPSPETTGVEESTIPTTTAYDPFNSTETAKPRRIVARYSPLLFALLLLIIPVAILAYTCWKSWKLGKWEAYKLRNFRLRDDPAEADAVEMSAAEVDANADDTNEYNPNQNNFIGIRDNFGYSNADEFGMMSPAGGLASPANNAVPVAMVDVNRDGSKGIRYGGDDDLTAMRKGLGAGTWARSPSLAVAGAGGSISGGANNNISRINNSRTTAGGPSAAAMRNEFDPLRDHDLKTKEEARRTAKRLAKRKALERAVAEDNAQVLQDETEAAEVAITGASVVGGGGAAGGLNGGKRGGGGGGANQSLFLTPDVKAGGGGRSVDGSGTFSTFRAFEGGGDDNDGGGGGRGHQRVFSGTGLFASPGADGDGGDDDDDDDEEGEFGKSATSIVLSPTSQRNGGGFGDTKNGPNTNRHNNANHIDPEEQLQIRKRAAAKILEFVTESLPEETTTTAPVSRKASMGDMKRRASVSPTTPTTTTAQKAASPLAPINTTAAAGNPNADVKSPTYSAVAGGDTNAVSTSSRGGGKLFSPLMASGGGGGITSGPASKAGSTAANNAAAGTAASSPKLASTASATRGGAANTNNAAAAAKKDEAEVDEFSDKGDASGDGDDYDDEEGEEEEGEDEEDEDML